MRDWKQLEQLVKTTYFVAAQLRGFIKCGRVRPHTKKVVFNKLFSFLKGTIYLTPMLAKELRYRFA